MPRHARVALGGYCYHVTNRGNHRETVFHSEADYDAFLDLLVKADQRVPMRVLAYCLMPNHFHLTLWPHHDGDLSTYMAWLLTAHVRRHHQVHVGSGHIWQGRFKSFPIQEEDHLFAVLRYIERNPLRANLVLRAEDWRWSSLRLFRQPAGPLRLDPGPLPRPAEWLDLVHQPQTEAELSRVRASVTTGTPYGAPAWTEATARALGIRLSARPPGRPRK